MLSRRDLRARSRARARHAATVLLLAALIALALPCMALGQVASRDLARNTVLVASDIAAGHGTAARDDRAGEADAALPVGWVTRRAIRAGERLAQPAIVPPRLVRRGDTVTLLYDDGAVQVSRRGAALRDAARDETCSVRVAPAVPGMPHVVLAGRVIRAGVVALDPPVPSTR